MEPTNGLSVLNEWHKEGCIKTGQSEEEYVSHLIDNIHDIAERCKWSKINNVEQEYLVYSNTKLRLYPDIVLFHENNTATIIECKGDKSPNKLHKAVGQILIQKSAFEKNAKVTVKAIISAPNIPTEVFDVIKENKLPIDLLEVNNDTVTYLSNINTL